MIDKVKKRDGSTVKFDQQKIQTAIEGAFGDLDKVFSDKWVMRDIMKCLKKLSGTVSVEEIQDIVETVLMKHKHYDVAKQYIRYRRDHEVARYEKEHNDVASKLMAESVQNQNANVDEKSFGGRIGEASEVVMKNFALEHCMSEMARNNHLNNEIYIHDLGHYAVGDHNCLSIPFDDLLKTGFNTRQIDVRPANSVNTAFQLIAVVFQLQSLQQFGGVSATHLDWTMVPYVRKSFYKHFKDGMIYAEQNTGIPPIKNIEDTSINDDVYRTYRLAHHYAMAMTEKEVYQAVEGMYHNLNTLQSRSGCQLPFTSINYGTCTLPEGRMVIKAILDVSIEGLGALHRTSIFPCGIFQSMEGVNRKPDDPNYDLFRLALKSTATRLYPNYANVEWSGNAGFDRNDPTTFFSTMGKRKL